MTNADLQKSVSGLLSRFGIDKAEARKAKESLDVRIGLKRQQEEMPESDERYYTHFISHFSMVDLSIEDILIPTLSIAQQSVYRRLYRLSFGFGRNWCQVSISELRNQCNISARSTIRQAINDLQAAYCIKIISPAIQHKAPIYRVFLPCEMPQFEDVDGLESGILFLKQKPEPGQLRGLNVRSLKTRPLKTRPLIFDSVDELRGLISDPEELRNRRLNSDPPTDKSNNDKGLIPAKTEEKISINSIIKSSLINTLSPDQIVSSFYRGINQQRISKQKREKAKSEIKELATDDFSLNDIQFAVEWTLRNAKEDLYDFSIIKHTIGQAMTAKSRTEAVEVRKLEEERAAIQNATEEKKREEEKAKIDSYKEALSPKERTSLRERVEAEIRESGQYKKEFITEHLIEAKENELVRKQINI